MPTRPSAPRSMVSIEFPASLGTAARRAPPLQAPGPRPPAALLPPSTCQVLWPDPVVSDMVLKARHACPHSQ